MGEPLFFGGLAKHSPESVGEDGAHVGDDGRSHYHHEGCSRAHPTPAHASACAGEEAVAKGHRDITTGQFVDPGHPAVPMGGQEVAHLDLSAGQPSHVVASQFNRPLIVPGHESNSPQNRGGSRG